MARPRTYLAMAGVAVGAVAGLRHLRRSPLALHAPGGILMRDTATYDLQSRLLLGSFFRAVAADVASVTPSGARVLEVGCGPGHLSIRLARDHGLAVSGLDLDPSIVERARADAERSATVEHRPAFEVGDVAALPFPDDSFSSSSARCRCITGPTPLAVRRRSTGCCGREAGPSSGTSGRASCRSIATSPTRSVASTARPSAS